MTPTDVAVKEGIKNLAARTCLEAAKDYCDGSATPAKKKRILKDLKGQWMDFFTDGLSKVVAEELQKNEKAIGIRLNKIEEEN